MPLTDHIRPEPNPPLTPARVETARAMYGEGFTVSRICAQCLISLGTLYACLDGMPFGADGPRWEPLPRRRNVLGKRTRALRADPLSLRNRLIRTAEGQVREIELRLAMPGRTGPERERDIRMLGMTVKSLRDLARLDAEEERSASASRRDPPREIDHDSFPEDFSELRRRLAARLNALAAKQEHEESGSER